MYAYICSHVRPRIHKRYTNDKIKSVTNTERKVDISFITGNHNAFIMEGRDNFEKLCIGWSKVAQHLSKMTIFVVWDSISLSLLILTCMIGISSYQSPRIHSAEDAAARPTDLIKVTLDLCENVYDAASSVR